MAYFNGLADSSAYAEWLTKNPAGYVLEVSSPTVRVLHRVSCAKIGATNVTGAAKHCSPSRLDVSGLATELCSDCTPQGLITALENLALSRASRSRVKFVERAEERLEPSRMIIAQQQNGRWTAWCDDCPHRQFGGDTAALAVSRLCEAAGINPKALEGRYSPVALDCMEFTETTGICPDCKGTGKYVGLNAVEECRTCGGGGKV